MENQSLDQFDPTVAELTALVESTRGITATDLSDESQMAIVKQNRISLKNARVSITKKGKELRESALAFQKAVIAKEKELVAIIEPEEDRLEAIEAQAKEIAVIESRKKQLPYRREKLASIGDMAEPSDEHLLSFSDAQFDGYFNQRVAEKNEADRIAIEHESARKEAERQEAAAAEQQRIEAERAEKQAEIDAENARIRAEQDARQAELDRKEREFQAEQERIEKTEAYANFLSSHGYSEENASQFKIEERADGFVLYRVLGIFDK